jgi:hypothetical protein
MKASEIVMGAQIVLHSTQVEGIYLDPELGPRRMFAVPGLHTVVKLQQLGNEITQVHLQHANPKMEVFETNKSRLAAILGPWSDPKTRLLVSFITPPTSNPDKFRLSLSPLTLGEWANDLWPCQGNAFIPYFNIRGNPDRLPPDLMDVFIQNARLHGLEHFRVDGSPIFSDETRKQVRYLKFEFGATDEEIVAATGVPVETVREWGAVLTIDHAK